MNTSNKKLGTWKLAALLVAVAIPCAFIFAGCNPECVDNFDCASKTKTPVCSAGKCVAGNPNPTQDAGTDGG